ncbi:hypothetical protein [Hymenobacter armeniacus]|uniref:Uncharacterized protein n=1 Tax=Hymenobacter armeniacus TaxID=2771358 RepID=A0ABR8JYP8_9BACT|nr:hypothetical protein [Hymenobacter armeniacus]MBD2723104.1 hypothetical protein [Hymenobacter armeniacus]
MVRWLTLGWVLLLGLAQPGHAQPANPKSDAEILKIIQRHRPSQGATIPANIKHRLGATHVGGKYHFTTAPYLVEGSQKMAELGFGVIKLWFYKRPSGYQYNSSWNLPANVTLKQLAQHPYYQAAFAQPFSTILLSTSAEQVNDKLPTDPEGLKREEAEYYDLARHLLEQYRERDVRFVLHNWEGDWILRGGTTWEAHWGRVAPPADVPARLERMRALFRARQAGVSRARAAVPGTKCRVYHAIEVNKVLDAMYGVPAVTTQVLPFVETDMVSWSAYDGTDFDKSGVDLYKGIDFIRQHLKLTGAVEKKDAVFLGEIGIPEMATKNQPQEFRARWDAYVGVVLAQGLPFMVQWELFCNETAPGVQLAQPAATTTNRDLNGFWLIRPDGTKSYVMNYFDELLHHAGGKLPRPQDATAQAGGQQP